MFDRLVPPVHRLGLVPRDLHGDRVRQTDRSHPIATASGCPRLDWLASNRAVNSGTSSPAAWHTA